MGYPHKEMPRAIKNEPYVKKYGAETGELLNPINGMYGHQFANRESRRASLRVERFVKNTKSFHMTVSQRGRFKRVVQRVPEMIKKHINGRKTMVPTGKIKTIEHYLECAGMRFMAPTYRFR